MNRNECYCTVENVSKNYPHSNVLYALYASAHVYMKCGNNVLGANINTMLATTIGMVKRMECFREILLIIIP